MISFANQPDRSALSHDQHLRWYACYTRARHEKQVDRLLQQRGVESFLPLIEKTQQWKDRRKLVSFVMFPSYVFARFSLEHLSSVVSIPGIATVVRNNGAPVAIADVDLDNVRRFAEGLTTNQTKAELVPLPHKGDRVCITAGPFEGISGIVVEHRKRCRILVGLEAIGWGLQVEVDAGVLATLAA